MSFESLKPSALLLKLRVARAKKRALRRAEGSKNSSTQEIFSEIYRKGLWGNSEDPEQRYYSGSGSHDENLTSVYLGNIEMLLRSLPNKPDVVDLGCGDFSIGSKIRQYCNTYIACDIVPELIEYNKRKYGDLNVDFRTLNLITDPLPTGDIVFIRQVLQHLSNEQIGELVPKLPTNYKYLILTEHLPKSTGFAPNINKPTGPDIRVEYNSGIVLTKPPFNLRVLNEKLVCEAKVCNSRICTTLYQLN